MIKFHSLQHFEMFNKGLLTVRCEDQNSANSFSEYLEELGVRWNSGHKPTEWKCYTPPVHFNADNFNLSCGMCKDEFVEYVIKD